MSTAQRIIRSLLLPLVFGVSMISCSEGDTPSAARPSPPSGSSNSASAVAPAVVDPDALKKRGKSVYVANCQACHNPDPSLDGALGPAVSGASMELLEARVLRSEYPEGYVPKRDTKLMFALPHLSSDMDALAAFLTEQTW